MINYLVSNFIMSYDWNQEYNNEELDDMYCGEWLDDDDRAQREHLEEYYKEYPEYRYKSPFEEDDDEYLFQEDYVINRRASC